MDVRSFVTRWIALKRQDEFLVVETHSPATLTLRQGRVLTAFDRLSRTATQQGKVVAPFGSIRHIRVHEEPMQSGSAVWSLTVQLAGTRSVKVGRCLDRTSAAQLAGQIGTVTGAAVVFGDPTTQ